MADMVRLAIDFENPEPRVVGIGRARTSGMPLIEGFDNNDALVDRSIADSWLAEAAKLPGWHGGPEFSTAPHLRQGNRRRRRALMTLRSRVMPIPVLAPPLRLPRVV